jgi:hypothetical protein
MMSKSAEVIPEEAPCLLIDGATLSLFAGLIHLRVTSEHFEEWWGYGAFYLVAAVAQMAYGPLLLRWPSRTVLVLGITGNSAIILLYLLTRAVGEQRLARRRYTSIRLAATSSLPSKPRSSRV